MSLGRLLAAGRTLMGSSDGGHRYRLSKQSLLPKFISPKNPFATGEVAAKPIAAERLVKPAVELKPALAGMKTNSAVVTKPIGVRPSGGPVAEAKSIAVAKPVVNGTPVAKSNAAEKRKRFSVRGWIARGTDGLTALGQKANPFSRRLRKAVPPRPVPRQVEMSLDAVKVVRNDLSDADAELARPQIKK